MSQQPSKYKHPLNRKTDNRGNKADLDGQICRRCGQAINRHNTKASRGSKSNPICGKCYLIECAERRAAKGLK